MTQDDFWDLIGRSREHFDPQRRDGNTAQQLEDLKRLLTRIPTGEVKEFVRLFSESFWRVYRWDLWAAAYIIGGGCSDDGFTDFRYWLISMGRDAYTRALENPESLVSVAQAPGVEDIFFEEFGYVGETVLEERNEQLADDAHIRAPEEPLGEAWTEEDLPHRLPQLWSAFRSKGNS